VEEYHALEKGSIFLRQGFSSETGYSDFIGNCPEAEFKK
jgi:hypothetical protein